LSRGFLFIGDVGLKRYINAKYFFPNIVSMCIIVATCLCRQAGAVRSTFARMASALSALDDLFLEPDCFEKHQSCSANFQKAAKRFDDKVLATQQ
jgi:hypothetical protein